MHFGDNNDTGRDKRGLFTRFLNPLYRTLTKSSNLHNGFLGAISNMFSIAQKDVMDAKDDLYLDTAKMEMLDYWGLKIGVTRRVGEDDESYRERIKKYILVLRNTKPAIEDALKDYLGDDNAVVTIYEPYTDIFYLNRSLLNGNHKLQGNYYRYAVIDVTIDRAFNYEEVKKILDKFKANGVIVYLTYNPSVNTEAEITEGYYNEFKLVDVSKEVNYLTAFSTEVSRTLTLATSNVKNLRDNVFITNDSHLNGEDVLAGGVGTSGRVSTHAIFYAPSDYVPQDQDIPTDMVVKEGNEELPPDAYTVTSFQGGAYTDVAISKDRPLVVAYDIAGYIRNTAPFSYDKEPVQYVRVAFQHMPKGLDFRGFTVKDDKGAIVSNACKVYLWREGETSYREYVNGDVIKDSEHSDAYVFLKLENPTVVDSVAIQFTGAERVHISVSKDSQTYNTVAYGALESLKEYDYRDVTTTTNLQEFLGHVISEPQFSIVARNYLLLGLSLEVYNFDTAEWETWASSDGAIKETLFTGALPCMDCYLNKQGASVIRLTTTATSNSNVEVQYIAVQLDLRIGLRYTLDMGMSVTEDYPSQAFDTTLDHSVKQEAIIEYPVVNEVPHNRSPFLFTRIYVEEIDTSTVDYFTMTEPAIEGDPRGFGSGLFAPTVESDDKSVKLETVNSLGVTESVDIGVTGSYFDIGTYNTKPSKTDFYTEFSLVRATFTKHRIVYTEEYDYWAGKVVRDTSLKGQQVYSKTLKEGFSFDNPYGDGTDESLITDDFFTTTKVEKTPL